MISLSIVCTAAAQLRVELPFTVGNELGERIRLVVGVDERATDGIDTALGEREIPPFHPPQDIFHAALRFYDSIEGEWKWSYVDFRPLRRQDTFAVAYRFVVQRGRGRTIVLQWNHPLPEHVDSAVVSDRITGTLVRIPFGEQQQGVITNEFLEEFVLTVWYRFGPVSVPEGREGLPLARRIVLYDLTGRLCWAGDVVPERGASGVYVGFIWEEGRWRPLLWVRP